MSKAKRIFVIGDFRDESSQSIRGEGRRWIKGLIRLGHDIQRFSYRNVLLQLSLLKSKKFAKRFVKKRTDEILAEQVRSYYPDIVLILGMKILDTKTVTLLRQAAPSAIFVGRDSDACPERHPARIAIAREMDLVVATNAGRFLKTYKQAGVPKCAFVPNVCDPDIQHSYDVEAKWKSDLLFIGKERRVSYNSDIDRYNLLLKLSKVPNVKLYGCFGRPKINGLDCFLALNGAKVALSINAINDARLYHSDRLVNCLACGTFVLSKKVPDNPKPLYLIGSWLPGVQEPLILLTTMVVENLPQAQQIIGYYQRRWACEEASQFLKSRVGLERFRIRRYEAIQRLVILAMIAMGFLTWILLRSRRLVRGYFSFTSRFRKKSRFAYYRLLDGLQEFARLYQLRLGKIPLEPLKNG